MTTKMPGFAHSRVLDRRQRGSTPVGRGRAKAKQIKVARKLKYYSPETDLTALQRELGGSTSEEDGDPFDEEPDYSEYADKYNDIDDD
ncbi:DUF3073 domain-containing protein [Brevibacterium pityocampae]|uniref:DUF3073 domain-containing protein n=1 Tax=Brevibacterium pityocampae TaxID=506594 RepID=A0ABP8J3A2_9MICO